MRHQLNSLLILLALTVFGACKPSIPRHVIQPADMEDILFDYHVADAMANQIMDSTRIYNSVLYKLAVLKKHGVTEAEFDSSMVYYTRHADKLHEIYERLAERMGNEAMALGADVGSVNRYNVENGEAANVWIGERCYTFIPQAPYNKVSFELPVDTSYHQGDRIVMDFDTQFLYQEGMRDGVAILAVRFANDSVATRLMHMSSDTHYSMEIYDDKSLGIKGVRGMFYLNRDRNATQTTLKVMVLNKIRVIRVHEAERQKRKALSEEAKRDSAHREEGRPGGPPPNDPQGRPLPPDDRRPDEPPVDRPMEDGDHPAPPPPHHHSGPVPHPLKSHGTPPPPPPGGRPLPRE